MTLTYPEPIPILKGKDAVKFEERLKNFSLSEDQVMMYFNAKRKFIK